MKIEPQQVRFFPMWPHVWWRRLRFLRKGNSLQAQETGLVVQGYLQKLWMPVADIFFRSLLSEWTTVTVPYSRILFLRTRRFIVWRVLATVLVCLPVLIFAGAWLVPVLLQPGRARLDGFPLYIVALLGLLGLVLALYVNCWMLVTRHYLLFEEPEGGLALMAFRIRRPKLRRRFVELVDSHRRAIQGLLPASPARP